MKRLAAIVFVCVLLSSLTAHAAVKIDSVEITDPMGNPATAFGRWDPLVITTNYTIIESDPLPCTAVGVFKAFGKKIVAKQKHTKPGTYSMTTSLVAGSITKIGTNRVRCMLKMKHLGELLGRDKVVREAKIVDAAPAFIMAHRGGNNEVPENTLVAFTHAISLNANPEMDVRLTSDDHVVVIHDPTVDRTTDGTGSVAGKTLSQIKLLDAGSWFDPQYAGEEVPTIKEVFALFSSTAPPDMIMSVDTKVENNVMYDNLIAALDTYNLFDRVFMEVSSDAIAQEFSNRPNGDKVRFAMCVSDNEEQFTEALNSNLIERIHCSASLERFSERIDEVHHKGKTILPGIEEINVLANDAKWDTVKDNILKIDGINTDSPEFMREELGLQDLGGNSFTTGSQNARKFGVHEIQLTGSNWGSNPFNDKLKVRFTPLSGNYIDVLAFYDGGSIWKARVYISETGNWEWEVISESGVTITSSKQGSFKAYNSDLKGMLKKHPENNRQWITDNGRTFLNLIDTSYRLFNEQISDSDFKKYVQDDDALGITSLRAGGLGGYRAWEPSDTVCDEYEVSNWCWDDYDYSRHNLDRFQKTDERLEWMLNNCPDMYVQLILFGKNNACSSDIAFGYDWFNIDQVDRENTMDYMISRWSAWPQVFYQIVNDAYYAKDYCDVNADMAREVGLYFAQNDPWNNLISTGNKKTEEHPLILKSDFQNWHTYLHIEKFSEIDAAIVDYYYNTKNVPVHVYYGEDWYESSGDRYYNKDARYYMRRMFWAILLSGGSPSYGGRYATIHPYTETGSLIYCPSDPQTNQLIGLEDIIYLKNFIECNNIDFAYYNPDDSLVEDLKPANSITNGLQDPSRPQAAHKADYSEYLVYYPNAADGEEAGGAPDGPEKDTRNQAHVNPSKTPQFIVDLGQASGKTFDVTWQKPEDGAIQQGNRVSGGSDVIFTSPWTGVDVILYLKESPESSP